MKERKKERRSHEQEMFTKKFKKILCILLLMKLVFTRNS